MWGFSNQLPSTSSLFWTLSVLVVSVMCQPQPSPDVTSAIPLPNPMGINTRNDLDLNTNNTVMMESPPFIPVPMMMSTTQQPLLDDLLAAAVDALYNGVDDMGDILAKSRLQGLVTRLLNKARSRNGQGSTEGRGRGRGRLAPRLGLMQRWIHAIRRLGERRKAATTTTSPLPPSTPSPVVGNLGQGA